MFSRVLASALLVVALSGCDRKADTTGAAPSVSAAKPSGVLVTPSKPPSPALDALDEMKTATLLSKNGWKTTTVGRAPAGANERAYRAVGIKTIDGKRHDAEVFVRCPSKDSAPEGSAYFDQGGCRMRVFVRIGIVVQPEQSKALLERLLSTPL